MTASSRSIFASLLFILVSASALAAEKNGLLVTVGKTTLDRADQRGGLYL